MFRGQPVVEGRGTAGEEAQFQGPYVVAAAAVVSRQEAGDHAVPGADGVDQGPRGGAPAQDLALFRQEQGAVPAQGHENVSGAFAL